MPDVAISCGKVSHSSKFEKRCDLAPGDSHGPHGPRNDMAATTLPHWSYSSINGKLGGCASSRPIVF